MLPMKHTNFRNKSLDMEVLTSPEECTHQVTTLKIQSPAEVVTGNSSDQARDTRAVTHTQKLVVNLFGLHKNISLESHMGSSSECGHENDLNVSDEERKMDSTARTHSVTPNTDVERSIGHACPEQSVEKQSTHRRSSQRYSLLMSESSVPQLSQSFYSRDPLEGLKAPTNQYLQVLSPCSLVFNVNSTASTPQREHVFLDLNSSHETDLRHRELKKGPDCNFTCKKSAAHLRQKGRYTLRNHRNTLSRTVSIKTKEGRPFNPRRKRKEVQDEPSLWLKQPPCFQGTRILRLVAFKRDQPVKYPRRNQPVVVLNHPDADSQDVKNVMKIFQVYKGNVLKVKLSERTRSQLGITVHPPGESLQSLKDTKVAKRQKKWKMEQVHKNKCPMAGSLPVETPKFKFTCWFCGRLFDDQEQWMSHGQRHLTEATRDWDVLTSDGN